MSFVLDDFWCEKKNIQKNLVEISYKSSLFIFSIFNCKKMKYEINYIYLFIYPVLNILWIYRHQSLYFAHGFK